MNSEKTNKTIVTIFELPMSLGMLRYVISLIAHLPHRIKELMDLIYCSPSDTHIERLKIIEEKYHSRAQLPPVRSIIKGIELPLLNITINYSTIIPLRTISKIKDYSLVHIANHTLTLQKLSLILGKRTLITVHDIIYLELVKKYPHIFNYIPEVVKFAKQMKCLAKIWCKAHALITYTYATKQEILSLFKELGCRFPTDSLYVVPAAVDDHFFPRNPTLSRKLFSIPEDSFVVLYVGTDDYKRLPSLLALAKSLSKLRESHPSLNIQFIIAGKIKDYTLNQLRSRAKVEILYLGSISEAKLPYLYSAANVFVFPTLHEGFGIPPLEAMACGTPVIASDIPQLREVLGDAALYAAPLNTNSWYDCLEEMVNENTRTYLKKKALERAHSFSWRKSAARLASAYISLLRN